MQAEVLRRPPRAKLRDLKKQSECLIIDLWFPPFHFGATEDTESGLNVSEISSACPGSPKAVVGLDDREGGALVRVVGPRAAVESARVLLSVVLRYLDEGRMMRDDDLLIREKLSVRKLRSEMLDMINT